MALRALYDVAAPAKLNLFLHVIGRRADGYHSLQSVFVLLDWCDRLHFELRDDGRLARHDLSLALPADDLCLRAARSLQAASGSPLGADISVAKNVPSGAGMGGGSSDAASTLLALNRLWGLNWPRSRLWPLAQALGADVPFFLGGRNAFVEGIGERVTPLTLPACRVAVVKPAAGIETKRLFQNPLLARNTEPVTLKSFSASGQAILQSEALVQRIWSFGRNDLQLPAMAECSEIAEAASWLENRFGSSRMTGSGSAVFAKVGTASQADVPLQNVLEGLPPGWDGRMCRSLEAHPLVGWAEG